MKGIYIDEEEDECKPIQVNEDWLIITTQRIIPENVKRILQLGPTFAVKSHKIPLKQIVTDVEYVLRNSCVSLSKKGEVRHKFLDILKKLKSCPAVDRNIYEKNLIYDLKATKKFMKDNSEMLVLEADKGKAIVIMQKNVYV